MTRSLMVLAAMVTLTFAAAPGAAGAQPNSSACDYTLSPPQVVQVSGTDVVTATLSPAGCNGSNAYLQVACLQVQGDSDRPANCRQNNGNLTAQVYYAPYRPGTTYVSTGRGCATTGNPPEPVCASVGPITVTL